MKYVRKRDGRLEPFDQKRITNAIWKAAKAVGGKDRKLSEKLSDQVVAELKKRFGEDGVPTVEEIQDLVEKTLIENGHARTAKAYILYRKQHQDLRELAALLSSADLVDQYLEVEDWRVRENSNMSYSLQGLNNYLSSTVIAKYWIMRIYPPNIADAHFSGAMHIHDLGVLGPYCVGWDIKELLLSGFGGVSGKIESTPAKHFRTALGQVVNFFYTLQGEAAGAQAFSNFDTYLMPFIRYDGLNQKEVEQALQEFFFNMNVPTRVGFQCLSEDTEILTLDGWKSCNEVKKGDIVYTFSLTSRELEKKPVKSVFIRTFKGIMYNLRNRTQDQIVSPGHRIVRQTFNSNKYKLEPIESALKLKSPLPIPTVAENNNPDLNIEDDKLKLIAWILSEGSIERTGSFRVNIYQSKKIHPEDYNEIVSLLGLDFQVKSQKGWGDCNRLRLTPVSSKIIHKWLGGKRKVFPTFLLNLSKRQARLFLETYIKGDGWKERYRKRIVTTNPDILEGLEALAVLAGFNFVVRKREPKGASKRIQYVLSLTESKHDYIQLIKKVEYDGIIWSIHTDNETVIAKRSGQVFITGNTPFTNVTLDLTVPEFMKDEPVIVGGKVMNEAYGDMQTEMEMFNNAFAEVMSKGDAKGRVFTFPIPTYNITKDFDWDSPIIQKIFEVTAKYGVPYFSNFISSDMKPEDVRSMCCRLRIDNRELRKRGGGFFGANPLTGSIGVVTLNLPRIGYLAKDEEEFFEGLEALMEIAKDSLEVKRKVLEKFTENGLYPYSKRYLRIVKEGFGKYWKNHFSTIGLVGMNEAILNLFGYNIASPEALEFARRVLHFMREKLADFQEETENIYNLEATPAEGTCYRLARIDKRKYPDIVVANEKHLSRGAEPFYTNSSQLPVDHESDLFEALEHQDRLQPLYTGGTVFHIYLGEKLYSWKAAAELVRKVAWNSRLPYFTLTPTFSICPTHGYIGGEHKQCPMCGANCEVYSRVVGYLRPVDQWNDGKQAEFAIRRTFDKSVVLTTVHA
ncbi:MAG: ribonucleoside triphosphate reductase [Candidatus Bathyarchaeia archaeon]|nr:ribonucleoside triphosphate reductase [Candidatus Bathyarchaeia archaeon]